MSQDAPVTHVDVLIVGAGPTGLTLANGLSRYGMNSFLLIEKLADFGESGRAINLWARTQEALEGVGVRAEIAARANKTEACIFYGYGEYLGATSFTRAASPYARVLSISQRVVQDEMGRKLAERGHKIAFETTLVSLVDRGDYMVARICGADGSERVIHARFVAACDGSRSAVRDILGVQLKSIPLPDTLMHQIDARLEWGYSSNVDEWKMYLLPDGQAGIIPLPDGYTRFFTTRRVDGGNALPDRRPTLGEMQAELQKVTGDTTARLSDPVWFGFGHLRAGIAPSFHYGRVFLVGDAGHMTIPVGAQGMNTGIQDAFNLAWKLSAHLLNDAPVELVHSYAKERYAVRSALARDQAKEFKRIVKSGPIKQYFVKKMVRRLLSRAQFADLPGRDINMLDITYKGSDLSVDNLNDGKGLAAGERAPYVRLTERASGNATRAADTFELFYNGNWTLLALDGGDEQAEQAFLAAEARARAILAARLQSRLVISRPATASVSPGTPVYLDFERRLPKALACDRGALILVRPDGHIGFKGPLADADRLARYLAAHMGHGQKNALHLHLAAA